MSQLTQPQALKLSQGYSLSRILRPFVEAEMVSPSGRYVRVDSCGTVRLSERAPALEETPSERLKLSHPLTTVLAPSRSSWIHAVTYLPRHDLSGKGFLLIFTKDENGNETALAYTDVPSWLKGLLLAGQTKKGSGRLKEEFQRRSIGRAYHLLVRGKYPSQTYTSPGNVGELKKMFGVGQ